MDRPTLPEHLQLLLSDEPVFDLYSHGPWRVPDGLFETVRRRALELNRDPAAEALAVELPEFELVAIFESMATAAGYVLHDGVREAVLRALWSVPRDESFGNGRVMRNLLDRAVALQAERITTSAVDGDEVRTLRPGDLAGTDATLANRIDEGTGQYL